MLPGIGILIFLWIWDSVIKNDDAETPEKPCSEADARQTNESQ